MAHDRSGELVEALPQLEVDVQSDAGRLVDEERERVVERRQLGSDLAQLLERERAHPARRGTVTHLLEAVGVREHERPPLEVENVELDQVDAHLDGRPERAKGVLGSERRRAAMTDAQDAAGRAVQIDHDAPPALGTGRTRRIRRIHHQAARPTTMACATTIAAASFAVSSPEHLRVDDAATCRCPRSARCRR